MAYAELRDDSIAVQTVWTEKELVKQIPGSRWNPDTRDWELPLTWASCVTARGVLPDLIVGPELAAWSWRDFRDRVEPTTAVHQLLEPTWAEEMWGPGLRRFQEVDLEFMRLGGSVLLANDMGLGKTISVLGSIRRLGVEEALPALVICPNSTKVAWEKHTRNWAPDATPYVVHGGAVGRRKVLQAAAADPTALVIVNLEAVRLLSRLTGFGSIALRRCRECDRHGEEGLTASRCEVHPKELNGFGFKTVVLDEAHRIKEPSSKQTRACWAAGHDPSVRRRWALTGTPIANHVGDLWSILHFVAPAEYPVKGKFIDRYALQSWNPFGGLDIVGVNPHTRAEFYRILDARFRRVTKAEVLDLPPKVRSQRWVEMTPKQKKAYDELEQGVFTVLESGQVLMAADQLAAGTRLLQLASSYCDVEWVEQQLTVLSKCRCYGEGLDRHAETCPLRLKMLVTLREPSPKLDALEEIHDELGPRQYVVSAMHRKLIELAAARYDRLRIPHGLITGPVGEYERERVKERFIAGDLQVVMFTLGAGGTGLDGLQVCDTMVRLQRSWSMIDNFQAEDRNYRMGSEVHDSVHLIDIVTRGTTEETVQLPRLLEKSERLDEITRDRARLDATSELRRALDAEYELIVNSHLGAP